MTNYQHRRPPLQQSEEDQRSNTQRAAAPPQVVNPPTNMSEPGPSSSPKGSPTSSPGGGGGGGVLGRLLHSLRPPLKRTYTSNQIATSQNKAPGSAPASGGNSPSPSSSSLSGSAASASVSRRKPRRSNSSPPRPPSSFSRRKSGGGSNNMALQQQQQEDASHQHQGQTVSSVSGNSTPNINAPSPRSSNEYSNNSRYSPNGSSNYEHSFSETASRHTTRQASPLASPIPKNASSPNLSVHLLGASSTSASAAAGAGTSSTSSSQRPPLDRRQSSSRRLAAKLSRPLFRRTSSQKDAQQQQQSQRIDAVKSSSSINNAIHPLSSSSMASSSSSAAEQPQQQQQRRPPSSLGPGSGPPSPAIGSSSGGNSNGNNGGSAGKRPFTISSATARSTASSSQHSHAHSVTTPLAISETASAAHHHQQHHHHQQSSSTSSTSPHPSPFFSQATPTTNIANPFAPPIDCVPPLTAMLAQPITATLAQLVPLSLLSPYASQQALCGHNTLGSLPSASTTSIASSSISEAPTSSSAQHTAATSSIHPSSSSYHSMTPSMTSTFACNEQLAASSLSIPTTAIGTVWRLAKASEWVSQHGSALNSLISNRVNPMTPRAVGPSSMTASSNTTATTATAGASTAPQRLSQLREVSGEGSYGGAPLLPVFDFSAMLQAVVDILASSAGERGVDLVFYHGHRHQYYPDSRRASVASQRETSQADVQSHELQEAFVRADERGLGVAILVMLRQIMNDLQSGTTLEVGLSVALTTPLKPNADLGKQQPQADQDLSALSPDSENDDDDDEDEDDVQLGTYMLTIEITTSRPRGNSSASSMTGGAAQAVDTNEVPSFPAGQRDQKVDPAISSALFQYLRLSFMTLPHRENRQEYKITCALPQARSPPRTVLNADHALRRRKPLDQNKEPSVGAAPAKGSFLIALDTDSALQFQLGELLRFAESSLRGKKVALHALEHSTFAHHLSHHLANWGLEVSHVPVASEDDVDPLDPRMRARPDERGHLGRLDSGFGGSDGTSPPQSTATPSVHNIGDPMASATASAQYSMPAPTSSISAAPIDPTLSFIIIDDDITALKKQVMAIKNNAPTLQLQNALLAKRPQLHSRRTRSTQAVQRVAQPPVSIIHFTSLSRYRQIKELVHATLKSASPVFALPEVLVVPKPVGPRRLLNTLYNAVRRPPFDPYYIPIATSPSSPGGHYFFTGSRPSPAPSNQNEFEAAAAAEMSRQRNEQSLSAAVSQISGPGTPPVPGQVSNPPSPASPDAMEYFSKSASELGSSASQGIIIQSPDGRPTGLFFQPRAASLAEKAESLRMSRNGGSDSSSEKGSLRESSHSNRVPKLSPAPGHFQLTAANGSELPSIVIPENMDLAAARAFSVSSSKSSPQPTPGLTQRATDHNAQATQAGDTSASKPAARTISESYSDDDRDSSTDSLDKQANNKSKEEPSPKSPRHPATSPPSKSPASPPLERPERQPALSPISTGRISSPPTAQLNTPASVDPVATPTAPAARARNDRKASGRIRKPPRRPTGTLVPPINVLIVEDNPINQIILSTFLKRKGIKYSVANNGQEAVDQWKAGDFHLVLMDIQLPVKDGIEATQEIRGLERSNNTQFVMSPVSESGNPISASNSTVSSPYELPVIIVALTASNLQSDRVNALAAGCNDFLTKPVSLQWLNQKLVEWGSMAYLSGFSNKRRNTISNPRDQSQENKSLGAQAVDLSSRLETQKKEESSIGKQNVVKPVDGPDNADRGTSQGDETPRLATRDHTPSASGEPATA